MGEMGIGAVLLDKRVLVDTDPIVVHYRRGGLHTTPLSQVLDTFDAIYLSAISYFEIERGAKEAGRDSDIDPIREYLTLLPFSGEEASEAASICGELKMASSKERSGRLHDIMVAGTARKHDLPILTDNTRHYEDIDGIIVADTVSSLLEVIRARTRGPTL